MSPSPASSPLLVETLCTVHDLLDLLVLFRDHAAEGRQLEASRCLTTAVAAAPSFLPVLKGLIAAQRQAADVRDASERTATTIGRVFRRQAQEHFHAANDQAPAPEQPSPSVA